MKTQFLPLLAIITLMGFTANVAKAADYLTLDDANTEAADATEAANAANGNASSAAQDVNKTAKGTEDKLDDAQRAQDAVPPDASAAQKDKAQKDLDKATANANVVRDGSAEPGKVKEYRQALKERRDARKRLKLAIGNLQRLIQGNNQVGIVNTDMTTYQRTVREAKAAEKDVDTHIEASVASDDSQVYVAVHPRHEESEIHPHVASHQNREAVRENDKQVVSLMISLRPSCGCNRY